MTSDLTEMLDADDGADLAARMRDEVQRDPLAMVRAATAIAHGRGRLPPSGLTRACREEVTLIQQTDISSMMAELEGCLVGRDVDLALEWLHQIGFMQLVLPELEATVGMAQEAGRMHKDVWAHTKQVVKQAVPRPEVRWAALLHDIGKVPTRTFTRDGVHFHGHAEVGARMFDKIWRRMPFERPKGSKIRFLIKHHLRSNQYSDSWTDSAVRRFTREMEEHMVDLLDLSRADITSKRPGRRQSLLKQISELQTRVETLREEDARLPPLPPGVGNAIMSTFGLPPSRRVGELRRLLEQAIESGELEARREDEYYIEWLARTQPDLPPLAPR
ncbi:MAG TPA: HD domain-containing protein [Kofleriaceae bacterium]|nr:HD domain-containing protein [Kofleriaceae bacterium]